MPSKRRNIATTFEPRFWAQLDGRTGTAQAIRERYDALRADAGVECEQRDLLAQRAVFLSLVLETQECVAVANGTFDLGAYVQAVNGLTGMLKALGLDKRAKDTDVLRTYIQTRKADGKAAR
jgi:hypothetical protein